MRWQPFLCVSVIGLGLLVITPDLSAQRPQRGGGGTGAGVTSYDTSTIVIVEGVITAVERVSCGWARSTGVHVSLLIGTQAMTVHLGPSWFLDDRVQLEVGERIEVKGSRVDTGGTAALIAAELRHGASTIRLRSERGLPAWGGARRRI
jgi:hypothetical protein